MKLSVVMSCYNSEKYLASAIDSILNQTFTDFEFIIWNDGSTDRTEEIIKSYDDSRIRYFYHENTGLGQALRLACQEVKSPIIARMDTDDMALPDRLQKEYDYLQSHQDVVLVSSAVAFMGEDGKKFSRSFPYTNDRILKKLLLKGQNALVHPASMFRTDIYNKAGGYMGLRWAEDKLLFARMLKYGRAANISNVLLYYRMDSGSISSTVNLYGYGQIVNAMISKMISDEYVAEEDIELFNMAIAYSKREKTNKSAVEVTNLRMKRTRHIFYYMYNILKPILGTAISENLVVAVKNMAGYIKTCR